MRTAWAAWAVPITTFIAIAAFIFVLSGGGPYSSSATGPSTPAPPPAPAQHINTRSWRVIAEDPAGHAGDRVVVWGQVTRFDPTTDASTFRANVDAARHTPRNGVVNYPTDVIMHGDPYLLRHLARGYIFTAEVTVDGASTVTSTSGDEIVVTRLTVTKLAVTDKTVG
jgi:hypothetical protein